MVEDAYCVKAYQVIRKEVGGDAVRISEGRNLYPPSPAFLKQVGRLTEGLLGSDRFTYYESAADQRDRELVAGLLAEYLEYPGIEAQHVLFTNGSQEAISVVCAFCAAHGFSVVLPLPAYYSYEQSSLRWGMPLNGYYRTDGNIKWLTAPADDLLHVVLLPNPITGEIFAEPQLKTGQPRLTLLDCIYQLGAYGGPAALAQTTRATLKRFSLDEVALLFTPSKDLSLPGLRCGVLVTGNEELMRFARADRFERAYSVNPLLGQIIASYLALLLLNERPSGGDALYKKLHDRFRYAGVPFASAFEFVSMIEQFDAMIDHCRRHLNAVKSTAWPLDLDYEPFAGYSIFPRLHRQFENSAAFLSWSNYAGREHGLKLNPAYIFGGTPDLWAELYPGEARIRVNVSYSQTDLSVALQRLRAALGAAKPAAVEL